MTASVFHIELRQFPRTGRRFNLSQAEIQNRFLAPWVRGQVVELDSQQFTPAKAKLSIYEGRQLATAELGLGRGWQNATRTGTDVTERELNAARSHAAAAAEAATASPAAVKVELLELCAVAPVAVSQALVLASATMPTATVSVRLAIAEQAVGELLREGRVQLARAGETEPIAATEWGSLLLAWDTWAASPPSVMLVAR